MNFALVSHRVHFGICCLCSCFLFIHLGVLFATLINVAEVDEEAKTFIACVCGMDVLLVVISSGITLYPVLTPFERNVFLNGGLYAVLWFGDIGGTVTGVVLCGLISNKIKIQFDSFFIVWSILTYILSFIVSFLILMSGSHYQGEETERMLDLNNLKTVTQGSYLKHVFISYRCDPDKPIADRLYTILTRKGGLKVYMDTHAQLGVPFNEDFAKNLCESMIFVPIISKEGMKEKFEEYKVDDGVDNVLLEWTMALELQNIGKIKRIFPVFVGRKLNAAGEQEFVDYYGRDNGCVPDLRNSKDVIVASTSAKAKEFLLANKFDRNVNKSIGTIWGEIAKQRGWKFKVDNHDIYNEDTQHDVSPLLNEIVTALVIAKNLDVGMNV
jgi:hypothetical protein